LPTFKGGSATGVDEQPDNASAIDTDQHAISSLIDRPLFITLGQHEKKMRYFFGTTIIMVAC
jgi:hypothetical protein